MPICAFIVMYFGHLWCPHEILTVPEFQQTDCRLCILGGYVTKLTNQHVVLDLDTSILDISASDSTVSGKGTLVIDLQCIAVVDIITQYKL